MLVRCWDEIRTTLTLNQHGTMIVERRFSHRDGEYKLIRHNLPQGVEFHITHHPRDVKNVTLVGQYTDPTKATEALMDIRRYFHVV